MLPWWWIRESERRALGLGLGAERTAFGVVFGDAQPGPRIEVVAATDDASSRLGDISLRLWGDAGQARGRYLLRAVTVLLGARRKPGFEFGDGPLPFIAAQPMAATTGTTLATVATGATGATATTTGRSDGAGAASGAASRRAPETERVDDTLIDVPSVCERACVFCHVSERAPALRFARGSDEGVLRAIAAAPGAILFTGDDALANPRIVHFVAVARARREDLAKGAVHADAATVGIIGPPRLARTAALAAELAAAGLDRYITGIFGPDDATHDAVAGRDGALAALVETAAAFRSAGISVELLTPLIKPTLARLPAIVERAASIAPGPLTLVGYAPDAVVGASMDALLPSWTALRSGLAGLGSRRLQFSTLPVCVLPSAMRSDMPPHHLDPSLETVYPPESCDGCAFRARCPGVARTVVRVVGAGGLGVLPAP